LNLWNLRNLWRSSFAVQLKRPLKVQVVVWHSSPAGPRVLLFQVTERRGGFWQPVTGSVDEGEEVAAAAAREAAEETGWMDLPPPVALGFVHRYPVPERRRARYAPGVTEIEEHAFAIQVDAGRAPTLDPHEHQEFRWCSPDEALALCPFEPNREAIRRALRRS
jgi:dATP pyrophosphohydrolase